MVKSKQAVLGSPEPLDAVFAALGDRTRRAMLERLAQGPATVGELAAPLPMSLPAVSKHLAVLERAGLVSKRQHGRALRCALVEAPLAGAEDWLGLQRRFWAATLDSLAAHIAIDAKSER